MEFFDFDQASHGDSHPQTDTYQDLSLPSSVGPVTPYMNTIDDDLLLEVADEFHDSYTASMEQQGITAYADDSVRMQGGYQLAKKPCDYCRERQLRCFIVDYQSARCSSCISLFRTCSLQPPEQNAMNLQISEVSEIGATEDADEGGRAFGPLEPFPTTFAEATRDSQSRKGAARFSRAAVKTLKDWLAANATHPYPTEEQKDDLKKKTGLKTSQIANWLANARRRGKVPVPRRAASMMDETMPIDFPVNKPSYAELGPMDRWKASPPEHEPASVSAIANALATTSYYPGGEGSSSHSSSWAEHHQDSSSQSSFSQFRAPSVSSGQSRLSSGSLNSDLSFGSVFSNHSSRRSFGSVPREKRRRRRISARNSVGSADNDSSRPFQCTFCTETFKTKHDWQRHEKSLHLSLEKWTCAPHGATIRMPAGNICVFCNAIDPDEDHLETHNFSACQEKPHTERTFYRKDHLRQHFRLMHSCKFDVSMESWKRSITDIRTRCGFCGPARGTEEKIFTTWQQRVDHLSAHFRSGCTMFDWKGDWGLEPHVLELLELDPATARMHIAFHNNYKPQQSSANPAQVKANPSAVPQLSPEALASLDIKESAPRRQRRRALSTPSDGNGNVFCKVVLGRMLGEYVRGAMAQGHIPTDVELQDEARWIVFRDRDSWNQTTADDPAWLDDFKRENGIAGLADGSLLPDLAPLTMESEESPVAAPVCPEWTGTDYPPFTCLIDEFKRNGGAQDMVVGDAGTGQQVAWPPLNVGNHGWSMH